jgi:hypothetical protein
MTTTPLPYLPDSGTSYATTVIGTADQLTTLIANHRTAGTLIAVGRPFALPYRPGHYQLRIRLRNQLARPTTQITPMAERASTRSRRRRRTRIAATITAVTGGIAGLTAVAAYLLGRLVELIAAHLGLLLGVVAVALLLAALVRAGACPGIHCPGCRHR